MQLIKYFEWCHGHLAHVKSEGEHLGRTLITKESVVVNKKYMKSGNYLTVPCS
jgi:hypothetical protein